MTTKQVGLYLAACRRRAGLTQRAVADYLGMTDRTVSDWERGKVLPSFDVMVRLVVFVRGEIGEATRLLLAEHDEAQSIAARLGAPSPLLAALAGLPVDPNADPEGRYAELARQISVSPWLVERLPDILSLTHAEFVELMDYLAFRRARQSDRRSSP